MAQVPAPSPQPPSVPRPAPEAPRVARREAPPFVGGHGPGASAPAHRPEPPRRGPRAAPEAPEEIYVPGLTEPRAKPRGRAFVLGASLLAVLAIGGISAAFLLRVRDVGAPLPATVSAASGDRITLTVSIPDAANGRLRVGAATAPIDATGRASVEVTPTGVGEQRVAATVERGSASEPREIRYFIAWRAEPQLNELGSSPPRLLLVFHVPPGAALSVSDHPIRVANGVGIASIEVRDPLPATDPEGARRYAFPVRVEHRGAVSTGEYAIRVRRTALRVDDPGVLAATDASLITVRGTAPRATRVQVGQVAATVTGDTFSADVPLTVGPNTVEVVAFAPGGVPAGQRVTIYRGTTPDAFLAATPGEHGAAALANPRDGARVRVRGTVLRAIEERPEGRTFQMVVADRACPEGRCVLWVDPPRSAAVREGQTVEATGELAGTRAYFVGGERRSAPVLRAPFVQ